MDLWNLKYFIKAFAEQFILEARNEFWWMMIKINLTFVLLQENGSWVPINIYKNIKHSQIENEGLSLRNISNEGLSERSWN